MKSIIQSCLCFFICMCFCTHVQGGILSSNLTLIEGVRPVESNENLKMRKANSIFKEHTGYAKPGQLRRHLPGVKNEDMFFHSSEWKGSVRDIYRTFDDDARQIVKYKEAQYKIQIKINNTAHSRSLNVKGNLTESLMDDFYHKDGWEKLDSKYGRQGIDGLYVKRHRNGAIKDFIVVDGKSGSSQLGNTQHGKQLSPKWIKHNIKKLKSQAIQDYNNYPTLENKKRVDDLKRISKLEGRPPRVFSTKIIGQNGKIFWRIEQKDLNGRVMGRSIFVDMQKTGRLQKSILRGIETEITSYAPTKAKTITGKIKKAFEQGSIRNDSDLYRIVKREIPDRRLTKDIARKIGLNDKQVKLAGLSKKTIWRQPKSFAGTGLSVFYVVQDVAQNGLTWNSARDIMVGYGADVALDYMSNIVSKRLVMHSMSKQMAAKGAEQLSKKMAANIAKGLGGLMIAGVAGFDIYNTIDAYNQGTISARDRNVKIGITSVTTGGIAIVTFTEVGTKIGATIGSIIPGAGTISGGVIGAAIGAIGAVGTMAYDWWSGNERQKQMQLMNEIQAKLIVTDNEKRRNEEIQKLREEADRLWTEAWEGLRAH